MTTAYVVCRFKIVRGVPCFKDVGIYSEFPLTTTDLGAPQALLLQAEGSDYDTATRAALKELEKRPPLHWVLTLRGVRQQERG